MNNKLKRVKPGHIRVTPIDNRFLATSPYVNSLQNLPEWFRRIPKGKSSVRACAGISDFLSTGFTIPAWTNFTFKPFPEHKEWAVAADPMNPSLDMQYASSFSFDQTGSCPMTESRQLEKMSYPKLITPWRIQTAPGWSCIFIPHFYESNQDFEILPSLVHTDFYQIANIVINPKTNTEFSIKYGTPLAHVIPFKRNGDIENIDFMDESFYKYASSNMYMMGAVGPVSGTGIAYRKAVRFVDSVLEKECRFWKKK